MGEFKVTCCKCGSDNVLEMSSRKKIDWVSGRIKYALGIQRKCIDCDNEDFVVLRTNSI